MGTIDFSKFGGISGKIGPVVAYVTKNGQQRFRTYTKPTDPRTPKQLAQRAKFALVNKELSPLLNAIKRGHPGIHDAYRVQVGKAYHDAIEGKYPHFFINFSKIQISAGSLQLPADARVNFNAPTNTATFTWDIRLEHPSLPGSNDDKVNIVCFDTTDPKGLKMLPRGTRAAGKATVELPADWEPDTTHFWLYFTAPDLRDNSNSVYLTPG